MKGQSYSGSLQVSGATPVGCYCVSLSSESGLLKISRTANARVSSEQDAKKSSAHLRFVREFSSADDVSRELHPIAD